MMIWLLLLSFGVMCMAARLFVVGKESGMLRKRIINIEGKLMQWKEEIAHDIKVSRAGMVLPVDKPAVELTRHYFSPKSYKSDVCLHCDAPSVSLMHIQS